MNEAHMHPARDQRRLAVTDALQQAQVGVGVLLHFRVVAGDDIIGQATDLVLRPAGRTPLERADTDVAGSDTRQHGARQRHLAIDGLARAHGGQRAGRGDTQRVHGLPEQIFAQDRPERGASVPAACKGRRA